MNLLSELFGKKYDDEQLRSHAEVAILQDPLISNPATLMVSSDKGVIKLLGKVKSQREKDHAEGVVRSAVKTIGLGYDKLVNEIQVG